MHISKSTRVLALALLGGTCVLFALAAAQQPSSTKPSLPGPGAQRSDAKTDGAKGNALAAKTDSIVHEALTRGRAFAMLEALCTRAPKRLAGSAGADEAVKWGEEEMKRSGLENVHLEE